MRLLRDRIHLQPDGVLTLTGAGPVMLHGGAIREMVETLLSDGIDAARGDSTASFRELIDFLETAGLTGLADETLAPAPARSGHVLLAGDADWVSPLAEELVSCGIAHLSVWAPVAGRDAGRDAPNRGDPPLSPDLDLVVGAFAPRRPVLQVELEQSCRRAGIPFLGAEIIFPGFKAICIDL